MHQWKFTVVMYGRGDSHGDAWEDAVDNFAEQTDGPSISDDLGEEEEEVSIKAAGITEASKEYS